MAVEPDEERCLGLICANLRDIALAEVDNGIDIAFDVGEQFFEPGLAFSICRAGGYGGKHCGFAEFASSHPGVETVAQCRIFDYAPTADQSGNVERLGGCAERNATFFSIVAGVEERGITVAEEFEVAVNFVADKDNAVASAERSHASHNRRFPSASAGVVRVAENHHLGANLRKLSLKAVEINLVAPVDESQAVDRHAAMTSLGDNFKRVIDRLLDKHNVVFASEIIHQIADTANNTRKKCQLGTLYRERMTTAAPIDNRLPIVVAGSRVAVDVMTCALLNSVGNLLAHLKIHIGNPKRL